MQSMLPNFSQASVAKSTQWCGALHNRLCNHWGVCPRWNSPPHSPPNITTSATPPRPDLELIRLTPRALLNNMGYSSVLKIKIGYSLWSFSQPPQGSLPLVCLLWQALGGTFSGQICPGVGEEGWVEELQPVPATCSYTHLHTLPTRSLCSWKSLVPTPSGWPHFAQPDTRSVILLW